MIIDDSFNQETDAHFKCIQPSKMTLKFILKFVAIVRQIFLNYGKTRQNVVGRKVGEGKRRGRDRMMKLNERNGYDWKRRLNEKKPKRRNNPHTDPFLLFVS